jgi:hypothetical protein
MDGATIKLYVHNYLQKLARGEVDLPPELVEGFADGLKENFLTLRKQGNDGKFTMRMSNLGKPICQTQMDAAGSVKDPHFEILQPVRFAVGDMLEHWLIMIMRASGLPIDDVDIPTELKIGNATIKGTADIILDGKVYDIKTASMHGFRKFGPQEGFFSILEDDPFGYVVQGFCYAKALGVPFGGWLVLSKNNGEFEVCEVPKRQEQLMEDALARAEEVVDTITKKLPFQRRFEDVPELWRKKPTGNRKLGFSCSWCEHKVSCWGAENLEHRPQIMSVARAPKWEWYTEVNVEKE